MSDYSETFGDCFTSHHNLTVEQIQPVIDALETEIGENLVYDHWHPEIGGGLQRAVHFLQTRRKEEKS